VTDVMTAGAGHSDRYIKGLTVKGLLLGSLLALCVVCFTAQIFIDGSEENMVSTALAAGSTALLLMYLWRSQAMTTHPLTSLALLGFTASSQFVALATQTAGGVAFTKYLRAPLLTFGVLATLHVVAIVTHWVLRHFTPLNGASRFIADKIYGPLGVHDIPQPITLWLLSIVGLWANIAGGGESGDVGGKFLLAFHFLLWMPFFIPLYHDILGKAYCDMKQQAPLIVLYALLIVTIALVKNFRAMMFVGPLQLSFVFLIYKCRTPTPVSKAFIMRAAIAAAVVAMALPSISDLMLAMQVTRAERGTTSGKEMLKNTFDTFIDKKRLNQFRDTDSMAVYREVYDEQYLDSPMLNRLSETKFHDNMLFVSEQFNEVDRQAIIDNTLAKVIYVVPQNILDAFDVKFKKGNYEYSNGDFYLSQSYGKGLGGYVTGSMWADLYVMGGAWFPFLAFIVLLCTFIPLEAFSKFGDNKYISAAALGSSWHIYLYGLGSDSLSAKINQVVRNDIQLALIFGLSVFVAGLIVKTLRANFFPSLKSST
jgi:hypothetical protein